MFSSPNQHGTCIDQLQKEHELNQAVMDLTWGQCRSAITALGAALGV